MNNLIVTIHREERAWPGTTRRTRVTGYSIGVHSMPAEHWKARVEFVGRARIDAAIARGDLEVATGGNS